MFYTGIWGLDEILPQTGRNCGHFRSRLVGIFGFEITSQTHLIQVYISMILNFDPKQGLV